MLRFTYDLSTLEPRKCPYKFNCSAGSNNKKLTVRMPKTQNKEFVLPFAAEVHGDESKRLLVQFSVQEMLSQYLFDNHDYNPKLRSFYGQRAYFYLNAFGQNPYVQQVLKEIEGYKHHFTS